MIAVVLRASGYTWKCPECGRENYTGPAPEAVHCHGCNGEFEVKELHHRRVEVEKERHIGEPTMRKTEVLPLFAAVPQEQPEEDIPF
jgi:hypothetical protein